MKLFAVLSSVTCIGAGVYLLGSQTVAEDNFLEVIARGLGIYMIGSGLFVGALLWAHAGPRVYTEGQPAPSPTRRRKLAIGAIVLIVGLLVVLGAGAGVVAWLDDDSPARYTDPNGNECLAEHVDSDGLCP